MSGTAATGGLPTDPAGREAMAGEYVLGTLDTRTARRVAVAMQTDPVWRGAVDAWEARLAPLMRLATPEAPPPDTWARIEARITPQKSPKPERAPLSWLWRGWAIGATMVAAGIAAFVFVPRPQPTRIMTVLVTDRNAPAYAVDVDAKGAMHLQAVAAMGGTRPIPAPGRALQLWGVAPGTTKPVSLGVLPRDMAPVLIPNPVVAPVKDMLIEISLEPEGGSRTGQPTGPVIFYGRLTEAGPDS